MPFKFILSIKKDKLHKGLRLQDREPSCSPSGFKKQGQAPPARARDVSRGRRLSKVDVGVGWAGLHPPEADQTGSLSLRRDHSKLVFPGKELTKKFFVCHVNYIFEYVYLKITIELSVHTVLCMQLRCLFREN